MHLICTCTRGTLETESLVKNYISYKLYALYDIMHGSHRPFEGFEWEYRSELFLHSWPSLSSLWYSLCQSSSELSLPLYSLQLQTDAHTMNKSYTEVTHTKKESLFTKNKEWGLGEHGSLSPQVPQSLLHMWEKWGSLRMKNATLESWGGLANETRRKCSTYYIAGNVHCKFGKMALSQCWWSLNLNVYHHRCRVLIHIDESLTFTKFAKSPNYKSC